MISGQQATAGGGVSYCSPYPWNPSGGNTPSGRAVTLFIRDTAAVDPNICNQAARRSLSDDVDDAWLESRGRRLQSVQSALRSKALKGAQDTVMPPHHGLVLFFFEARDHVHVCVRVQDGISLTRTVVSLTGTLYPAKHGVFDAHWERQ